MNVPCQKLSIRGPQNPQSFKANTQYEKRFTVVPESIKEC